MLEYNDSGNSTTADVSNSLINDSADILNGELKPDDSTQTLSSKAISVKQKQDDNEISDQEFFKAYTNDRLINDTSVISEYHNSEIGLVDRIISSILSTTKVVSYVTLAIVAVCMLFEKNNSALISGGIGVVIDIVLGVLAGLFNSTLKSKKSYFDAAIDSSKLNTMLSLITKITDAEKKDDIVIDILRKHFNTPNN